MGKKKLKKQIMQQPFNIEWPKVDPETEEKVFTALNEKMQEFPSLESKRAKDQRRKAGQNTETSDSRSTELSEDEEKELRSRLRRQLFIGQRQVCKALERDELALLLVSGDAHPPILLRSLLPLVASRACPALCLSSLTPRVTEAVGVHSLLSLGFKKTPAWEVSDFKDFVALAASLAPPLSVPWFSQSTASTSAAGDGDGDADDGDEASKEDAAAGGSGQKKAGAPTMPCPAVDWPIMKHDQEKEVLDRLIPLLEPYQAGLRKVKKEKITAEWRTQRRIIKLFTLMDVQGLRDAAMKGRLDLLLVQHERTCPHPTVTSAVKLAIEYGCPVLHMTQLKRKMLTYIKDNHFKAFGFKKKAEEGPEQPVKFQEFIAMASKFAPHGRPEAEDKTTELGTVPEDVTTESGAASVDKTAEVGATPEKNTNTESDASGKDKNTESGAKEHSKKPATPVYDVSSLYLYKTDQDKTASGAGTSSQEAANSGTENFISLSSEPTVQLLGMKAYSECISVPETAFVNDKDSNVAVKDLVSDKALETKGNNSSTEATSSAAFAGVMGLDSTDSATAPQPFFPEPGKSKPQASIKRKLDQSAERGEFISFKLKPTTIKTIIANPNKKKNQK